MRRRAARGADRGAAMHGSFRSRTGALALAVASIALSLVIGVGGPAGATAASPTVTAGRGAPSSADLSTTTFNLADVGYQASEFYLAGTASSYHNVGTLTANGAWTVAADATQQPYKTRIQVYRPISNAAFNGTVYVEWLNVTNSSDSAADWILTHDEITREGAVYVGVTAQAVGVNAAKTAEPSRYG